MPKEVVVISVGGSIIVPREPDYHFLKQLKESIKRIAKTHKVVICTGGGAIAREYIGVLRRAGFGESAQDMVGIAATRLNAMLVSTFLETNGFYIPTALAAVKTMLKKYGVVVCGGLGPGKTSDGTTAEIAHALKAKAMVNITNVAGLYDKDPRTHPDAYLIPRISHADFAKMIAKIKEKPGQHFVLDSIAAEIARKAKMKVIIIKGAENLERYLKGKHFLGTIIG